MEASAGAMGDMMAPSARPGHAVHVVVDWAG
jgi:hypothetical protein